MGEACGAGVCVEEDYAQEACAEEVCGAGACVEEDYVEEACGLGVCVEEGYVQGACAEEVCGAGAYEVVGCAAGAEFCGKVRPATKGSAL